MKPVSRIILDPLVLVGKPVVRETRISVDLVLELLASGWTESSILKEYPGLEREDILACIRYAQEIVQSERVSIQEHERMVALFSRRPVKKGLRNLAGTLTHDEAQAMQKCIDGEFEKL